MKIRRFYATLSLCVFLLLSVHILHATEGFVPALVKDISGRAYEPAVINLLDTAKESIVISMYSVNLGTKRRNPVRLLLTDLHEARDRGVSVTLYLNTKFRDVDKENKRLIQNTELKRLKDAGCVIHLMPYNRRLHDKLIIVDSRYVVEASTNWSITALRDNFESASLIDSPELAQVKLLRLEMLPVVSKPKAEHPREAMYLKNLPEEILLSETLVLDKRYFPKMLKDHSSRAIDLYLILRAYSQTEDKRNFFLDLECMGLSLGMPDSWSDAAIRRQVIKSLRKLRKTYKLIDVKFFYARNAWVGLIDIPGDTFLAPSILVKPPSDKPYSMRLKFYLIAEALFKAQGRDIQSITAAKLAKELHIAPWTIRAARKDLQRQ